jgi:transcriptional regulator with XRE-family HTH domain
MSRSSVCQWEKEGGTRPTFENLVAAAKLMRTSIDYLTGLRDNENTHEVNEKGAHYRNDSIPDSIRELLDAMIALPPAARHDINESIKNLTKLIRRIEEKK